MTREDDARVADLVAHLGDADATDLFRRLVQRGMQDLIDGHEEGMAKLLALLDEPKRAVEVFPALFRTRITTGNYIMATGESLAHLNCLIARGQVVRTRGADGADLYART